MQAARLRLLLLACLLFSSSTVAKISVDCLGSGQPVYLIGGGPAFTTWNLEPIQQKLSEHFKVCRWDMRGVGDNADLGINMDTPLLLQWIDDMATVLPQQPVVLWGHSWGALQVLLFARQYPDRVKALLLSNPVDPQLTSLEGIESRRYVHPYVESQLSIDDIGKAAEQRHRFRSKIASYFMDAETGWAYSAGFDANDSNNALNVRIWEEYRRMPVTMEELARLVPKINRLIYCKQDVLMPHSLEAYSQLIPPGRHQLIEDCAHFPWVESADRYYEILLQALLDVKT